MPWTPGTPRYLGKEPGSVPETRDTEPPLGGGTNLHAPGPDV